MNLLHSLTPTLIFGLVYIAPCAAKLKWGACDDGEFNTTLAVECSSVRVPLDYAQPDSESFELEIVKIPASITPSKGSILHNFGGPGLDARKTLVEVLGSILQPLSGGVYDLLAFDPRGVGKTLPFTCITDNPYLVGQVMNEFRSGDQADTALKRLWVRGSVDANICHQFGNANKTAKFIGTASTARDFMTVVEALEEDGMLRYWGFSYGTTLGATLAAMFPDSIDKMILDGVQNPHDYYNANADFEEWTDTDKVFSYFFETCIEAGPGKCALAALNKTAEELELDTWAWFDFVRETPIAAGITILDLIAIKGSLVETLKSVAGWPALAQVLLVALYGTKEQQDAFWNSFGSLTGTSGTNDSLTPSSLGEVDKFWGIHCGDRVPRATDFAEILPTFERLKSISRLQGDVIQSVTTHCAQWPWHAKEIYRGDFRVITKNPVLLSGNVRDAHTPIRSAFNVSDGFIGSRVLQVNGTGHTSIGSPSICTLKHVAAYWMNGTLPEEGLICDAAHPWDKYTWANVFEETLEG